MCAHVVPHLPNINLFAANERENVHVIFYLINFSHYSARVASRVSRSFAATAFSPILNKTTYFFAAVKKIHFVKTYSLFVFIIWPALLSTFRELQLCGGSVTWSFYIFEIIFGVVECENICAS